MPLRRSLFSFPFLAASLLGLGGGMAFAEMRRELGSRERRIVCLFYRPSFIIALGRQVNDNTDFHHFVLA